MAWTGRIDLRAGGIRRAAAGRRFVACAGNEVNTPRSGARRLRRRVCAASRCGVAGDGAQLKFLRLSIWRHQLGAPFHAAQGRGGFCVCQGRARAGAACCGVFMCVYAGADKRRSATVSGPPPQTTPAGRRCSLHNTSATPLKDALRDLETRLGARAGWSTATPADRTTKH